MSLGSAEPVLLAPARSCCLSDEEIVRHQIQTVLIPLVESTPAGESLRTCNRTGEGNSELLEEVMKLFMAPACEGVIS